MSDNIVKGIWYPVPPPALKGETDYHYTDRITGADGTGRVPYDHRRYRECSMGYHRTCSDPRGQGCECPCHKDSHPDWTIPGITITPAATDKLAQLYFLPDQSAEHVLLLAMEIVRGTSLGGALDNPVIVAGVHKALCDAYRSDIPRWFVGDVLAILRDFQEPE